MSRFKTLLLGAIASVSVAAPASAATIVLNDIGGVAGTRAERGFRAAARFWETQLRNDVRINLDIGFQSLPPNVLGGASSVLYTAPVTAMYSQLAFSATSAVDRLAVTNLSPLTNGALTLITPGYVNPTTKTGVDTTTGVLDVDGSANNRVIAGTSANLKALGFIGIPPGDADAEILFSSDFTFDFDPRNGINNGEIDFIGVAIHEIGHALGFVSGVDDYDFVGCPSGPGCAQFSGADLNNFAIGRVGDLFRYSDAGVLNWRPDREAYFSIDGGNSEFLGNANFSTGDFNGDRWQASHWKANNTCSNFIGVMNPYLCGGVGSTVTAKDIGFFDAIGWRTRTDALANPNYAYTSAQAFAAIPEPATWVQMILGFGLLGAAIRRVRRRAPVRAMA